MRIFCRIRHFPVHLRILGRRGLVFAVKTGNAISPVFVHLRVLGGRGVAFAGKTANAIVFFLRHGSQAQVSREEAPKEGRFHHLEERQGSQGDKNNSKISLTEKGRLYKVSDMVWAWSRNYTIIGQRQLL